MKPSTALAAALAAPPCASLAPAAPAPGPAERGRLFQDLVAWDNRSLLIRGGRAVMFSGEVHPFRLPVPCLWLDVLQKVKALGFTMVSFYVDWALLEGKPGRFRADGVFALEPFFRAAADAGIYLLARPGPYINAEVSGGGFPGWLQAGIVVPIINNDVGPAGNYAPGSGVGAVDIYGHDSYPLVFDCAEPTIWPPGRLPTNFRQLHMKQSPSTPFALVEFQGGHGSDRCAALLNHEFERVFFKNNYAAGVAILNVYMIFGGTNWGNLGHPGGYTSYDYGACIRENRAIDREKYAELKLQAHFFKVSPGYLAATPEPATTGEYGVGGGVVVTPLLGGGGGGGGSFFVVRHGDYARTRPSNYTLRLPTSASRLAVPQTGGALTLSGRDSKVHVVDYPVGAAHTLLYSTAEVLTWQAGPAATVLVLYAGPGEAHEFAVKGRHRRLRRLEGDGAYALRTVADAALAVRWEASPPGPSPTAPAPTTRPTPSAPPCRSTAPTTASTPAPSSSAATSSPPGPRPTSASTPPAAAPSPAPPGSTASSSAPSLAPPTPPTPSRPMTCRRCALTVVDTTGLDEDTDPGAGAFKKPRGILDYALLSAANASLPTPVAPWKLTGNLGGEGYADAFRGPLNEGGLFFERQGYHLPSPPLRLFVRGASPWHGVRRPGIAFYVAPLNLDYPSDAYDIALSFVFDKNHSAPDYRAILYVNGFQYGKYASYIGPRLSSRCLRASSTTRAATGSALPSGPSTSPVPGCPVCTSRSARRC